LASTPPSAFGGSATAGVDFPEDDSGASEVLPGDQKSNQLVFISYRVHPDQVVAAAIKKLVESTLVPCPQVFVSGLGGLRPSSIGFKPQLQKAVQQAHAFIGVITPRRRTASGSSTKPGPRGDEAQSTFVSWLTSSTTSCHRQ
jgi:hypothetical protein